MVAVTFAAAQSDFLDSVADAETLIVVAPASTLRDHSAWSLLAQCDACADVLASPATAAMAQDASGSIGGSSVGTYVSAAGGKLTRLVFVPLLDEASRLYSPTQSMAISGGLGDEGLGETTTSVLVVLRSEASDWGELIGPVRGGEPSAPWASHAVGPAACAIARACPLYSRKTSAAAANPVTVGFVAADAPGQLLEGPAVSLVAPTAFDAVRLTARLAETPTEQMNCDAVEAEARAAVADLPNVEVLSIVGEELKEAGLNAIHTVGRTSLVEPRLVVLKLTPTDPDAAAASPIGLVGIFTQHCSPR